MQRRSLGGLPNGTIVAVDERLRARVFRRIQRMFGTPPTYRVVPVSRSSEKPIGVVMGDSIVTHGIVRVKLGS